MESTTTATIESLIKEIRNTYQLVRLVTDISSLGDIRTLSLDSDDKIYRVLKNATQENLDKLMEYVKDKRKHTSKFRISGQSLLIDLMIFRSKDGISFQTYLDSLERDEASGKPFTFDCSTLDNGNVHMFIDNTMTLYSSNSGIGCTRYDIRKINLKIQSLQSLMCLSCAVASQYTFAPVPDFSICSRLNGQPIVVYDSTTLTNIGIELNNRLTKVLKGEQAKKLDFNYGTILEAMYYVLVSRICYNCNTMITIGSLTGEALHCINEFCSLYSGEYSLLTINSDSVNSDSLNKVISNSLIIVLKQLGNIISNRIEVKPRNKITTTEVKYTREYFKNIQELNLYSGILLETFQNYMYTQV